MVKNKKQLQILVLIGAVAVGVIVAAAYLWLLPTLASIKKADKETKKIQEKTDTETSFVNRRGEFEAEFERTKEKIRAAVPDILEPRLGNYLLPAQDIVYRLAGEQGLALESVVQQDRLKPADGGDGCYEVFRVRINMACSYGELVNFIKAIEADNAHAIVSAVTVTPNIKDPMKHVMSLIAGWLIWDTPGRIPDFCREAQPEVSETAPGAGERTDGP